MSMGWMMHVAPMPLRPPLKNGFTARQTGLSAIVVCACAAAAILTLVVCLVEADKGRKDGDLTILYQSDQSFTLIAGSKLQNTDTHAQQGSDNRLVGAAVYPLLQQALTTQLIGNC